MSAQRFPAPLPALAIARAIDGGADPAASIAASSEAIAAHDDLLQCFVPGAVAPADALVPGIGPLAGLTLGIKDIFDTAGFATEMGSPIYAGHRPRADAAVVAMALRAGATIAGKTVTTEFAFMEPGPTRNPAKLDHTPGGSSSGSAAAVAAGLVPIAFGTQTGGSVIRPAAFCGVAGLKPSFRLLPTVGVKCFSWSLDTVGLFAASVADVAYFAAGLTGRDLRVDGADPSPPRIGIARTHLWHEASGAMRQAVEQAGRRAAAAGATVVDIDLPGIFADAFSAQQTIMDFQAAEALGWEFDHHADRLSAILRDTLARGRSIPIPAYDEARRTARRARMALKDLFADVDVLLTPSAPGAAPEGLASTGSSIFNRLWTLMGVPAVNVPGAHDPAGLPLGLQIVAPFARDKAALEAGHFLERVLRR
jgi:Asp-tRNA(Asn)/Glu-tRNA(Gln) amidotransferase A subunit family amidase